MMEELFNQPVREGAVEMIGVRSKRLAPLTAVETVQATSAEGLVGDHFSGKSSTRQVTLIQFEHIAAIASFLGLEKLDPLALRRNLVISGINLLGLKDKQFAIGEVLLEHTGPCHPCSRMEKLFGPGGFQATRGHGGITARVVDGGWIRRGDAVRLT
ncbi:MAG: MOSC domain-containing protein YiiM [Verrucomicrobiales bacterium]|jgi:MOSC domain-containing protein YiiM